MSREIKFRALSVTGDWAHFNIHDLICHAISIPTWVYENPSIQKDQFTGLRDKNGKEIYEGDVTKCFDEYSPHNHQIFEVVFQNVSFQYKPLEAVQYTVSPLGCEVEVIGNIYENPELLK